MNEKSNKLISLLASLDRPQRRACRKLLQSPYFSTNEDLVAYFDEINKRLDRNKPLEKPAIWRSVHGAKKAFNDVRFRKFTSDLFKLVREFITQEALKQEKELHHYLYLVALEEREPEKIVRGVERNWDSLTEFGHTADRKQYLFRHLLEQRKFWLLNYEQQPTERANLEEISGTLDVYYIITKLDMAVTAQSRRQHEKQRYDLKFVNELVGILEADRAYMDNPLVELYYLTYRMLTDVEETEYFYRYKQLLTGNNVERTVPPQYKFVLPALNYCVRKIAQGRRNFLSEYLNIYRFALAHEVFTENNVIDPRSFKNTIQIAMQSGEFAWAKEYIDNYQAFLPEKQRENSVTYNYAALYFYQKNYGKAQDYLRAVEFEDSTYNLNAKIMLLAIFYETDADTSLESLFDSTAAYLNRHKDTIPNFRLQQVKNLVSFTRRLTRLLPNDTEGLEKLKAELKEKKYVASRPWLETKIREFGN